MPNEEGTTVGMYIGPEDESLLEDFDRLPGSRSGNLKRAMALYAGVVDAAEAEGEPTLLTDMNERQVRAWMRQLVLDDLRGDR
jgi:hypothetical protein